MSRTTTMTQAVDVFSRSQPPPSNRRQGIKRPPDPELILRLEAPKRQCVRDLHLPSQAEQLRELHQHAEDEKLEKDVRTMAQEIAWSRVGKGGSGHPLVKPVDVPTSEELNEAYKRTLIAADKLIKITGGHTYYGKLPPARDKLLSKAQRTDRARRNKKHRAAEKERKAKMTEKERDEARREALKEKDEAKKRGDEEEALKTHAGRIAAKERADSDRKATLTTRKPAIAYGQLARTLDKDAQYHLPPLKPNMINLSEAIRGGPQEFVFFSGRDKKWQLKPWDTFCVPVFKRVLDLKEKPQPIEFFRNEFKELHDILGEVVKKHFGQIELNEEFESEKGLAVLKELLGTVKLESLVDAVYDNDGNFMTVACDPKRRTEVVQAVIVRILHARVWNSLLFGASTEQLKGIQYEEKRLAMDNTLEGFARQKKRSSYIKGLLRQFRTENGLPTNFLEHVGWVTLEIFNLLSPMADVLRSYEPGQPQSDVIMEEAKYFSAVEYLNNRRQAHFTDIHNIVSMAAYLATCVRIHPTPIMIDLRTAGIKYDKELELTVVNYDEYRAEKVRLGKAHLDRKDAEAREMLADMEHAKRKCGNEYDKVVKIINEGSFDTEYELLADVWSRGGRRPIPGHNRPDDWTWDLENELEPPCARRDPIPPDEKKQGRWYLSHLRFAALQKRTGIKKEDLKAHPKLLREAYIEIYCGKFFKDVSAKYRLLNDAANRQPLVRTAVWPSVKLYKPGDGTEGGEQNGMRSWNITKGEAACHMAVPLDKRQHNREVPYDEKKLKRDQLRATRIAAGYFGEISDDDDDDDDNNDNSNAPRSHTDDKIAFNQHLDAINHGYRYLVRYQKPPPFDPQDPNFAHFHLSGPQFDYQMDQGLTPEQDDDRERRFKRYSRKNRAQQRAKAAEKSESAKRRKNAADRVAKRQRKRDADAERDSDYTKKQEEEKAKAAAAAAEDTTADQKPNVILEPPELDDEVKAKMSEEQRDRFFQSKKVAEDLAAEAEVTVESIMAKMSVSRSAAEQIVADMKVLSAIRQKKIDDQEYERLQEEFPVLDARGRPVFKVSAAQMDIAKKKAGRNYDKMVEIFRDQEGHDLRKDLMLAMGRKPEEMPDDAILKTMLERDLHPVNFEHKDHTVKSKLELVSRIYLVWLWLMELLQENRIDSYAMLAENGTEKRLRSEYAQKHWEFFLPDEIRIEKAKYEAALEDDSGDKPLDDAGDGSGGKPADDSVSKHYTAEEITAVKKVTEMLYDYVVQCIKEDHYDKQRKAYKKAWGFDPEKPFTQDRERLKLEAIFDPMNRTGFALTLPLDKFSEGRRFLTFLRVKEMMSNRGVKVHELVNYEDIKKDAQYWSYLPRPLDRIRRLYKNQDKSVGLRKAFVEKFHDSYLHPKVVERPKTQETQDDKGDEEDKKDEDEEMPDA